MNRQTINLQALTLQDRIKQMNDLELWELATSEALAMADSSLLEGLALDEERIREELLAGYRAIKAQGITRNNTDDRNPP
jgi:hypothetical protein